MEIEVVYYERLEGVLQKVAELVLYANDAPLSQILREELPEVLIIKLCIGLVQWCSLGCNTTAHGNYGRDWLHYQAC